MYRWLFCFQKSVAMVLAHLITSSEPIYDDRPAWMKDPVSPYHTNSLKSLGGNKKRSSFAESKTVRRFGEAVLVNRSFTTEDVNRSGNEGGFRASSTYSDNRIHSAMNSKSAYQQIPEKASSAAAPISTSFASSAILAMSPAIPIGNRNMSGSSQESGPPYVEKLATSYKDPDLDGSRDQFLIMHTQSVSPRSSHSEDFSPRASEDHFSETEPDDV